MTTLNPVMVCVTGQKTCDHLIQEGSRLAKDKKLPLDVIHVAHPGAALLGNPSASEALNYLYALSNEAGADLTVLRAEDPLETIIKYAQDNNVSYIVLGVSPAKRGKQNFAQMIQIRMPNVQVHVVMG